MCTPADDSLLIVGTSCGSLYLFDLNNFSSATFASDFFDYKTLLMSINPKAFELGETNLHKALKEV